MRRLLLVIFAALSFWSLVQASPLLSSMREFALTRVMGGARLALWAVLVVVAVVALLKPALRPYLLWSVPLVAGLLMLDVTLGGRDPDEAVHLRMCWFMKEGLVPYRDFFTVRNLFWHLLCVPLVWIMENRLEVLVAARVLTAAVSAASFRLLLKLAKETGGEPPVALLPVVCLPFFLWGAVEFRADPPMTLMLLGSLLCLARGRPTLAGVFAGTGFLMLQKAAIHGTAIGAGILFAGFGWSYVWRYSLAAVGVSSLHFLWAACWGVWTDYYTCAVTSASAFAAYHHSTPIAKSLPVLVFGIEFAQLPALFLAALVGCLIGMKGSKFDRLVMVCLLVDFAFVFLFKLGFKNYLLFPVLLLGLPLARLFRECRFESELEQAMPAFLVLLTCGLGVVRWAAVPPDRIDLDRARLVARRLPPGESYYCDGLEANLSSPIFRPSPYYYSHDATRFAIWFAHSGATSLHISPPNSREPLVENPPGAFDIESNPEVFLERVYAERGIRYVELQPGLYLREDLAHSERE